MICEYCGGKLKEESRNNLWITCRCVNCKVGYAFRPTREYHMATLKAIYEDRYEFVMKEYRKRKMDLIENAKV